MTADTALIMIDIQRDFCPGGALAVSGGDEIVDGVNALQERHPIRVLTQDWHPADHTSFAANTPGAEPYSITNMPYGSQVLWPTHCVQGTEGAAFHPALRVDADLIIRKGFHRDIDSYSAFFENDKTTPTGLAGYLRERGVGKLVLVGLATDFCVRWSAIDARRLGFAVTVRMDLARAIDLDGSLAAATEEMLAAGVALSDR